MIETGLKKRLKDFLMTRIVILSHRGANYLNNNSFNEYFQRSSNSFGLVSLREAFIVILEKRAN